MIAKNSKCLCGSGKQYKRCCIDNPDAEWRKSQSTVKSTGKSKRKVDSVICNDYPSVETLKLLSLVQLQPQNHGKNIRLETLVTKVVNSISEEHRDLRIDSWRNDLIKECPKHYAEDPPENFFSENIVFSNGNNLIYPGIFIDVVEILQNLITSTIENKSLPGRFVQETNSAILLILSIQTSIGQRLNHIHRMYEEVQSQTLHIPGDADLLDAKDLFSFSLQDIKEICDKFHIPYNTIDPFVFLWEKNQIEVEDLDSNPLFKQPFVFVNGNFILATPTALCQSLIDYILESAIRHNCKNQLVKGYVQTVSHEVLPMLARMGWKQVKISLPELENTDYMQIGETIWEVDNGKFAYVVILTENILTSKEKHDREKSFSKYFQKRVDQVATQLKTEKVVNEIMLLAIVSKIGLLSYTAFGISKNSNINYFLNTTPAQFIALINAWKLDKLSLWNFAKYEGIALQKLNFGPYTSLLAKYDYYKHNEESFFHSDEKPYNYLVLDLSMEGDVRRKGLLKFDKLGISYGNGKQSGYLQCIRKEEHYPVYISQEVYFGVIRSCLLLYSCPIWLEAKNPGDVRADNYVNAILFWLNEIHESAFAFINQLGESPIRLELSLDDKYYSLHTLENLRVYDDVESAISYKIDTERRQIYFTIPIQMIQFFSAADNHGERVLIDFILDAIGKLISALGGNLLDRSSKQIILSKHIPLSSKKMLLMTTGEHDIKIADIDLTKKRYIPDADISYILENQLSWLKLSEKLPRNIEKNEEKTRLLNQLVSCHYEILKDKIKAFDLEALVIFLARRHEALIQARAFRHLNYPAKMACYSKFYDVFEEFSKSEKDLVETSLATRILIEFVALQKPLGNSIIADNDVDIMLAHTIELINYASISDAIVYGIENPEIGELPSGRLGISKEEERKGIHQFREQMNAEEIHNYSEDFHKFFSNKEPRVKPGSAQVAFSNKLEAAFNEEWGITLGLIDTICYALCSKLISEDKSVDVMSEDDFYSFMSANPDITADQAKSFLSRMRFLDRPEPLKPPEGYENWEVYPWRFNRRLSYLLRPIVCINKNGKEHLILSARHLVAASENLMSLFFNGALKVNKTDKKIIQLQAERNKIKGKQYRNEVFEWIKMHTHLDVSPNEIKIKPNGFFIADVDKGDIDIMAIDRDRNILYSIECKNTIQSKLSYDYKMEIESYLGLSGKEGLIEKHVKRHKWLEQNIGAVMQKLSLTEQPQVKSLVISKNLLPMTYIKEVPIPVTSFFELKTGKFNFD